MDEEDVSEVCEEGLGIPVDEGECRRHRILQVECGRQVKQTTSEIGGHGLGHGGGSMEGDFTVDCTENTIEGGEKLAVRIVGYGVEGVSEEK